MNKIQKNLVRVIIIFFLYHTLRDYFQHAGIGIGLFTDLLHNYNPSLKQSGYWNFVQDTFFETIILGLAGYILGRNYFGKLGILMITIVLIFVLLWSYGYFLL